PLLCSRLFFFIATATTAIYPLSLHDALPICPAVDAACRTVDAGIFARYEFAPRHRMQKGLADVVVGMGAAHQQDAVVAKQRNAADRKSTRLNSSHVKISYAVFCLKKKINKRK